MSIALTDHELSIQAPEFVWSQPGLSPAHSYLLPMVRKCLRKVGARTVLDLGCGNGAMTNALLEDGFDITGLDISESGIAIASKNYPKVKFTSKDLDCPLPSELNRRFDAIVAVEVIEHLLLPRVLFTRAKEALRQMGTLVVTTPYHGFFKNLVLAGCNKFDTHWHPLRDYGHVKFFSRATLTRLFMEQGFTVDRVHRVGRIPQLAKSMVVSGTLNTRT